MPLPYWFRVVRRTLPRTASIAALGLLVLSAAARSEPPFESIQFVRVAGGVREFPEATEPGTIQYACAERKSALEQFYAEGSLEFQPKLVRKGPGEGFCHIYYEPTVRGFRAATDDQQVQELFTAIDPVSFVVGRKPIGDTLDAVKSVLRELPRSIDVTLGVNEAFGPAFWPAATEQHFHGTHHRVTTQRTPGLMTYSWAQDYMKSGEANGETVILVPRRLYEGKADYDELIRPMLDTFQDTRYVRSKLSWEGGDLQIADDPKHPGQRILFYGDSARRYWGKDLANGEYEYVLRAEFGAQRGVDLSRFGPHADYLVSFLPGRKAVLLAEPVTDDRELAKAAAEQLAQLYGKQAPPTLEILVSLVKRLGRDETEDAEIILRLIADLRKALRTVAAKEDPELSAALTAHIERYCPDNRESCFSDNGKRTMLLSDPELLRRLADASADYTLRNLLAPAMLDLIEGQYPTEEGLNREVLLSKRIEMERLGFKVVRAPYLLSPDVNSGWPGVSYVNVLATDGLLFVPTFGLGRYEEQLVANLGKKLPGYRLIPVDSRYSLAFNGGMHCTFGMVRAVASN